MPVGPIAVCAQTDRRTDLAALHVQFCSAVVSRQVMTLLFVG
jgi:hypothetical protein